MEDAQFDEVLASHEMNLDFLRASQPREFLADRRHRFLGIVEYALGKPVIRDVDEANLFGGEEGPQAFDR